MAADFKMNEAEMEAWKIEYDAEMRRITDLLAEVAQYVEETPFEGDSILNIFHELGKGLTTGWNTLTNMFQNAANGVDDMLRNLRQGAGNIFTGIGNWLSGGGK